jgi:hypothetical protein
MPEGCRASAGRGGALPGRRAARLPSGRVSEGRVTAPQQGRPGPGHTGRRFASPEAGRPRAGRLCRKPEPCAARDTRREWVASGRGLSALEEDGKAGHALSDFVIRIIWPPAGKSSRGARVSLPAGYARPKAASRGYGSGGRGRDHDRRDILNRRMIWASVPASLPSRARAALLAAGVPPSFPGRRFPAAGHRQTPRGRASHQVPGRSRCPGSEAGAGLMPSVRHPASSMPVACRIGS